MLESWRVGKFSFGSGKFEEDFPKFFIFFGNGKVENISEIFGKFKGLLSVIKEINHQRHALKISQGLGPSDVTKARITAMAKNSGNYISNPFCCIFAPFLAFFGNPIC